MTGTLLATWRLEAEREFTALVIPDGCRDLIFKSPLGEKPYWFLSSLEDRTCGVPIKKGDIFTGYRLKPGTSVLEDGLLAAVRGEEFTHEDVCSRLDSLTTLSGSLAEALACLASGIGSVALAARRLGMNQRSLQRLMLQETGQPPVYWLQLARVRRAGRAVHGAKSLAEIAVVHDYADQSHMSREFKRWLAISPSALRKGATQSGQLREPGFS